MDGPLDRQTEFSGDLLKDEILSTYGAKSAFSCKVINLLALSEESERKVRRCQPAVMVGTML